MTPPINSVSDHILDGIASGDLAASPFEVVSIAKELAARRAANTPVDGAETLEVAGWTDKLLTELAAKDPWDYADQTQARGLLMSFKGILAAALSASPAMPSQVVGVTVKPLEWGDHDSLSIIAHTVLGPYLVEVINSPRVALWLPNMTGQARKMIEGFDSVEDAKAAAQADFNARIQACLTSPAAEPVGWETEAEWDLETRVFNAANNRDVPEWARKVVADVWKQHCLAANPAPSASREVTGAAAELIRRVRDVLDELGPGGYLLPAGAVKTNYLEAACNQMSALLAALPERESE